MVWGDYVWSLFNLTRKFVAPTRRIELIFLVVAILLARRNTFEKPVLRFDPYFRFKELADRLALDTRFRPGELCICFRLTSFFNDWNADGKLKRLESFQRWDRFPLWPDAVAHFRIFIDLGGCSVCLLFCFSFCAKTSTNTAVTVFIRICHKQAVFTSLLHTVLPAMLSVKIWAVFFQRFDSLAKFILVLTNGPEKVGEIWWIFSLVIWQFYNGIF